jgi:raffinose/stachyose/melibiose transport system substrate-binding protein
MKWDREKIMNGIGFLLLAACFVYSLVKIATRTAQEQDEKIVTIRFAHWQLEGGIKAAFDAIAQKYMAQHPQVRVEQVLIPERVYPTWLTTRLVGQNPPDLVLLGLGMTDERLARYFVPLTEEVAKPNPYNRGTELETLAWRDTFVDGMVKAQGLERLFDYYGIPNSVETKRFFYNKPLYEKMTGRSQPPQNYAELQAIFREVDAYNQTKPSNEKVLAIAGSKYNSPLLMDRIFSSQTQKLAQNLDRNHVLRAPGNPQLAFFDGTFDLRHPGILSALQLCRELGQNMQIGFIQLAREDATFYFIQGRALMIASGSFDVTSLRQESPFEVGVAPIPIPSTDDPVYGQNVIGLLSEAEEGTNVPFGLAQDSAHPAVALDFLKFMTSQASNQIFTDVSNWLPAVSGVKIADSVKAFEPIIEGYPGGIILRTSGGAEVTRTFDNAFYRLVSPEGSVEKFMEAFASDYPRAMLEDGKLALKSNVRNISRHDTTLTALRALAPTQERAAAKALRLAEVQGRQENDYYHRRYVIWAYEQKQRGEGQ